MKGKSLGKPVSIADSPPGESVVALKFLARSAGLALAGIALSKILAFSLRSIIARAGRDDYGLYSLGFMVFDIASTIAMLGLSFAVLRFVPEEASRNRREETAATVTRASALAFAAGVAMAAVLFLSADLIATAFFHDGRLAAVIRILALGLPFYGSGGVLLSACRALRKPEYEVYAKYFAENAFKVSLAFAAVALGTGVGGVAVGITISFLLSAVLAVRYFSKALQAPFSIGDAFVPAFKSRDFATESRKLLGYSVPIMVSNFLNIILLWADIIVIGLFLTVGNVGLYNSALPIAMLLTIAPTALEFAFKPVIVDLLYRGKKEEALGVYRSLAKWIAIINVPAMLLLALFPTQVLSLLFGRDYAGAWDALIVLSFGFLIQSVFILGDDIIGAFDRTRFFVLNSLLSGLTVIALAVLLVPRAGIIGAAVASMAGRLLYAVLSSRKAASLLGGLGNAGFAKVAAAGLVAAAIAKLVSFAQIRPAGPLPLSELAMLCAFGLSYAAMLFALNAISRDDKIVLNAGLRKIGVRYSL
ncbi:flippase [Candidatus Micrarchaeota archaeon]|nr:flippase [Candidatus Micrarchaeota archaeon]